MKDYKLLFAIGLIVLVFPFLGFPEFFRNLVVGLSGAFLIGYAIFVRTNLQKGNGTRKSDVFEESELNEKDLEIKEELIEEGEFFEEKLTEKENE